jgi:hypothetical protein
MDDGPLCGVCLSECDHRRPFANENAGTEWCLRRDDKPASAAFLKDGQHLRSTERACQATISPLSPRLVECGGQPGFWLAPSLSRYFAQEDCNWNPSRSQLQRRTVRKPNCGLKRSASVDDRGRDTSVPSAPPDRSSRHHRAQDHRMDRNRRCSSSAHKICAVWLRVPVSVTLKIVPLPSVPPFSAISCRLPSLARMRDE